MTHACQMAPEATHIGSFSSRLDPHRLSPSQTPAAQENLQTFEAHRIAILQRSQDGTIEPEIAGRLSWQTSL